MNKKPDGNTGTDYRMTDEDRERIKLLRIVARKGLGDLTLDQLKRLERLVDKKDYTHDKKAAKSKRKLLAKINTAIFEAEEGHL